MKFVDEASIKVSAGKGGAGCLGFRREKYIERGGPDGGDGGSGGSIFLRGDAALNTLVDFRFRPEYRAQKGEMGRGSCQTGATGEDLYIRIPLGTTVFDDVTSEYLGDIKLSDETLLVAQGGKQGLGNIRFKSSTNRAPRQTTPGAPGESRSLRLELKLIADVGLLGMPNAGKSTLISRVSAARPRIADYPFTTLIPNLGVVSVNPDESFVMADIPGLIKGAADGAGLGVAFLKHLARTRLLLHLLDIAPIDGSNPIDNCRLIEQELAKYSGGIADKPRWLVFTKLDMMPADIAQQKMQEVITRLHVEHYFAISSVKGTGVTTLLQSIAQYLRETGSATDAPHQVEHESLVRQEIHAHSLTKRMIRRQQRDRRDKDTQIESDGNIRVHWKP